jgi:hypothetical protein
MIDGVGVGVITGMGSVAHESCRPSGQLAPCDGGDGGIAGRGGDGVERRHRTRVEAVEGDAVVALGSSMNGGGAFGLLWRATAGERSRRRAALVVVGRQSAPQVSLPRIEDGRVCQSNLR